MSQKHIETINSIITQLIDLRDNGITSLVIPEKKLYPEPGPNEPWTKDVCKAALKHFPKENAFKINFPKAYVAINRYGWFDEFFPAAKAKRKRKKYTLAYPKGTLTVGFVTEIANRYKTRSEFYKADESAYNYAHRNKFIDTLFPNGHLNGQLNGQLVEQSSPW
jgi:hypothetical protein